MNPRLESYRKEKADLEGTARILWETLNQRQDGERQGYLCDAKCCHTRCFSHIRLIDAGRLWLNANGDTFYKGARSRATSSGVLKRTW